MNNNNTNKFTFWEIIKNHSIVIPKIQRDYAHGRNDEHTREIRTRIVNDFYDAIAQDSPKDIDFVYGVTKDKQFIPLDGQQRLTTLFLLHWYIAKRANIEEVEMEYLKRFTYETRPSSSDFCKKLISETPNFEIKDQDIKSHITDQRWFYHVWKKDPTVQSMLQMIQSIHNKFDGQNYQLYWQRLKEKELITFSFLEIEKFGLSDDLYIKINSRGKPLTRFENFKVWFEKKYPNNIPWQDKIDNKWTDLFWQYRQAYQTEDDSGEETFDDEFMQFINNMLMFKLAWMGFNDEVQYFFNTKEISFTKYEDERFDFFDYKDVENITKVLDWLYENHGFLKEENLPNINLWKNKSIFETFISGNAYYPDLTKFYAIVLYIIYSNNKELNNKCNFFNWVRFSRNIIENTVINNPNRFATAIQELKDSIGKGCLNIKNFINYQDSITFFNTQYQEEKIKQELIDVNPEWEKELKDSENHPLFRGSIGFLLPKRENEDITTFKNNKKIAKVMFNGEGSIFNEDYKLIRAMLAVSDLRPSFNNSLHLQDNRPNWRSLLKETDVQMPLIKIIQEIKDSTDQDYNTVLDYKINSYNFKEPHWKYLLVKNKVLLSKSSERRTVRYYDDNVHVYLYYRIRWNSSLDNNILLSGYRNEIIAKLQSHEEDIKLFGNNSWILIKDKATENNFYRGYDIWLKKEYNQNRIWLQFKRDELTMGVLKSDANSLVANKETLPNGFDENDEWSLATTMRYPDDENEIANFVDKIIKTITVIENNAIS